MSKRPHLVIALLAVLLGACSTTPVEQVPPTDEAFFTADTVLAGHAAKPVAQIYDPWEPMNRRIYAFNYHFDKWVFLPVVKGYKTVVPGFARTGVHNFFNNWLDLRTFFNSALQLSGPKTVNSGARVVVNSTLGLLGFFDVATIMEIDRPQEDFGQTLGHWGVGTGPYLMLPLLGPSNLRDGLGYLPDSMATSAVQNEVLGESIASWIIVPSAIDSRANTSFRYYETGSAFEYDAVRLLISTKRKLDIER